MTSIPGRFALRAATVAAALAFGSLVSVPAMAAPRDNATRAGASHVVSDTDFSSHRRHWRRYGYVRPYAFAYHRPYVRYRPIYSPYAYYRPRPYYYRPYYRPYYYAPRPFFSIGFSFGPRFHHW